MFWAWGEVKEAAKGGSERARLTLASNDEFAHSAVEYKPPVGWSLAYVSIPGIQQRV